jgi:hypothetical protein
VISQGIVPFQKLLTVRGSATPRAHRRGDLGQQVNTNSARSPFHRREVVLVRENQSGQLTSESHVVPPAGDEEDGQRVIWGTNVSIADSMRRFREFLLGFQRKHRLRADNIPFEEGEGEEYTYVDMLKTVGLWSTLTDCRCVKLIFHR